MKKVYADILQFRGSHYDFGVLQGKLLKNTYLLKTRNRTMRQRKKRYSTSLQEAKQFYSSYSANLLAEFEGLRDSLEISEKEAFTVYSGYFLEIERSGCSIFAQDGYFVRNYDFHPSTYEGRLILFQPSEGGLATIGPTQNITGRMDGMNEEGLVIGYNFVNRRNPGRGLIPNMIARMILELCRTVDEAVLLLKEIPHFQSFNYVVHDPSERTLVIEASPREVKVRETLICTNHFEHLKQENRHHLADSKRRRDKIKSEKKNIRHPFDAFQLFNRRNQGVFSEKYASSAGTIHTSMYLVHEKRLLFSLGADRKPLIIPFDKWLEGEDFYAKKIIGFLNTDLSFAHMR